MRNGQSADIALLQERDFYSRGLDDYLVEHCKGSAKSSFRFSDQTIDCGPKGSVAQLDIKEIMDRIVWKGDFSQVKSVSGSVLKTVLKESSQFPKTEKTAYLPASEVGRPLVTIGVEPDLKNGGDYLVNGKPLDPASLSTVATSDYLGLGDTGYPELAAPPVGEPPQPASAKGDLATISGAACDKLSTCIRKKPYLANNYYDEIVRTPEDPRPGNTNLHKLYAWTFLHGQIGQEPRSKPPTPLGADAIKSQMGSRVGEKMGHLAG